MNCHDLRRWDEFGLTVRSKRSTLGGRKVMKIEGNNIQAEVYIPSSKLTYPPKVCFFCSRGGICIRWLEGNAPSSIKCGKLYIFCLKWRWKKKKKRYSNGLTAPNYLLQSKKHGYVNGYVNRFFESDAGVFKPTGHPNFFSNFLGHLTSCGNL